MCAFEKRMFEISGNLTAVDPENYPKFLITVLNVRDFYIKHFGKQIMNAIALFIDNATAGSGYTPIITPTLGQFLIIKLNIDNFEETGKIIYQLAHELCHYVFYAVYGLDKPLADQQEESICSAASLCVLKQLDVNSFFIYSNHILCLDNKAYHQGAFVAKNIDYDFEKLKEIIFKQREPSYNEDSSGEALMFANV